MDHRKIHLKSIFVFFISQPANAQHQHTHTQNKKLTALLADQSGSAPGPTLGAPGPGEKAAKSHATQTEN
jgi:hypothetical protein